MFSISKLLVAGLASMAFVGTSSARGIKKRADTETFSLYAYGAFDGTGARMFYADGQAYIGNKAPSGASSVHNVTFTLNRTAGEVAIQPEDTVSNWTTPYMFLNNNTNASDPVGFGAPGNVSSEDSTAGFGLYGPWLYHAGANGDLEMNFYVESTNDSGVYALRWNGNGPDPSAGAAVAIRTTAPSHAKAKL